MWWTSSCGRWPEGRRSRRASITRPTTPCRDGVDGNDKAFLTTFPYVARPFGGYSPSITTWAPASRCFNAQSGPAGRVLHLRGGYCAHLESGGIERRRDSDRRGGPGADRPRERPRRHSRAIRAEPRLPRTAAAPSTTRKGLEQTIEDMRARIVRVPTDARAAVVLADALLRQARVSGDAGLAVEAEHALSAVLKREPLDYQVRRMLATVYLSEHRFAEAVREAERMRDPVPARPLELRRHRRRTPRARRLRRSVRGVSADVGSPPERVSLCARSYAYELRGHLAAALDAMRMAADATSPRDPESLAWHHAQIASLLFQMGRAKEAQTEYARALTFWPGHPAAVIGLGRLKAFAGDYAGALALYEEEFKHAPTPDLAAQIGDVYAALGNRAGAERHYALAEAGWRSDAPEPRNLARFLADRGRSLDQAVTIAEHAARDRHDIFTEDALAWRTFAPAGWQKRPARRHCRSAPARAIARSSITRRRFARRWGTSRKRGHSWPARSTATRASIS